MMVTLTTANFHDVVSSSPMLVIELTASWSKPGSEFAPVYAAVAAKYPSVVFATLDSEAEADLAARFHAASIPTIVIVRNRVVLYSRAGTPSEEAMCAHLDEILAMDPDSLDRQPLAQRLVAN